MDNIGRSDMYPDGKTSLICDIYKSCAAIPHVYITYNKNHQIADAYARTLGSI